LEFWECNGIGIFDTNGAAHWLETKMDVTLRTKSEAASRDRPVPGRPRNPKTQSDIIRAAGLILVEEGYRALTMERLAARAGVGKTTVYRRWKSISELVSDVLDAANEAWPMPQTRSDNIAEDLRALYRNWIAGMSGAGKIIPILIAEGVQNSELAGLLHRRFILPRRRLAIAIIDRAKAKGQISDEVDSATAIDMFMGRMWYRQLVTGEKIRLADEDKVIGLLLGGLRKKAG
jgi:AcrR family transcriptional regulator